MSWRCHACLRVRININLKFALRETRTIDVDGTFEDVFGQLVAISEILGSNCKRCIETNASGSRRSATYYQRGVCQIAQGEDDAPRLHGEGRARRRRRR